MPFNSPGFLFLLLPACLAFWLRPSIRWQHGVLLVASFVFYWFAGLRDLATLLAIVGANYALARYGAGQAAKVAAILLNLGVLAFYKYWPPVGAWIGLPLGALVSGGIPLGISFYVFQLIAYQVDRARGQVETERSFTRLLLYVLFFPHHQAGPIMKPGSFLPQFHSARVFNPVNVERGVVWILYGLCQKVLADQLAVKVTNAFASAPGSMVEAWTGAVCFAAQIYGDFAGYSNIAIGAGLLFGFQLDRNFNQPYLATSPSEFWARWHITLSAWLREYVYIPLGGNRRGPGRTFLNLMLTMTVGGLWHGASWNFVLWGFLHGALLCLFRLLPLERLGRLVGWLVCQSAVLWLWVPFRAQGLSATLRHWSAMAGWHVPFGSKRQWLALALTVAAFLCAHAVEDCILGSEARLEQSSSLWSRLPSFLRGAVCAGVLLVAALFLLDKTTFIYFRF